MIFFELMFGSLEGIELDKNGIKIKFPEGIPSWLIPFITKMLDFDPKMRSSAQEILDVLNFAFKCCEVTEKHFKTSLQLKPKP